MIKIQISTEQMDKLLDEHWKWFKDSTCRKARGRKYTGKLCRRVDLIEKDMGGNIDVEALIKADYKTCRRYIRKFNNIPNDVKTRLLHYFGYDLWVTKKDGWNAYTYMQRLGVSVCPYCNRNSLDYSRNSGEKIIPRAHFDHFFSKDKYPFLSCSLYNLIPCCYTCNSAKHNKTRSIIYPFEEEFGNDGEFKLVVDKTKKPYNRREFRGIIEDNSIVKLTTKEGSILKRRINGADNVFHLSEIYSQETSFIRDLIYKIRSYSDRLGNMKLFKLLKKENEFFYLFFNLPMDDNVIYPYQKFTKDILKQIGGFKI